MHYVYILRSGSRPGEAYVGCTGNLRQRLADHNSGKSAHTRKYRPWSLVFDAAFTEKATADRFERYLKGGSGRAFARRHLFPPARVS